MLRLSRSTRPTSTVGAFLRRNEAYGQPHTMSAPLLRVGAVSSPVVQATAVPLVVSPQCSYVTGAKSRSSKVRKRALANRNRRAAKHAENIRKKMLASEEFMRQKERYLQEKEKVKEINRRARARIEREKEEQRQQKKQQRLQQNNPQERTDKVAEAEVA